MAVPKRKTSPSRGKKRHAANSKEIKKKKGIAVDSTTGEFKRPHHVSRDGYYDGRKVTESKVNY